MITEWSDLFRPGEASSFLDRRPLPLFHPQATAFDANNAWWLAELSRLVYRHDIEESPFLPQPRRTDFLAQVGCVRLPSSMRNMRVPKDSSLSPSRGLPLLPWCFVVPRTSETG